MNVEAKIESLEAEMKKAIAATLRNGLTLESLYKTQWWTDRAKLVAALVA